MVLLDAVTYVQDFVDAFVDVCILVILLWVILSWIRLPYSLGPARRFINDVCDPYLRFWRRLLPFGGPLDFSPIVGIVALVVLEKLLDALLDRIH